MKRPPMGRQTVKRSSPGEREREGWKNELRCMELEK
jgi:hypothetical protein